MAGMMSAQDVLLRNIKSAKLITRPVMESSPTVRFPTRMPPEKGIRFSCTTTSLCLCKCLKDRLEKRPREPSPPKSGCKGTHFPRTAKIFRGKISGKTQKT